MPIDSFTVLFCGLAVKVILGALFVAFWMNDRRSVWFAWWSATFFLGCAATLFFLLRGPAANFLTIGPGVATLIAGFACAWQGARVFDGRPPLWGPVLIVPAFWIAVCLIPGFIENVAARVVLSSLLLGALTLMPAVEFWRGRSEKLPSRWPVVVLFASFAMFFLLRIPLVGTLPFPFGALPAEPGWLGAFNMIMFFHTVILTVLLVAMSKERLELEQRTKAQTDPLTGALNRRAFSLRCARLMQRHEREGQPLCLLYLDLDRFKPLNDRHGHVGGDEILRQVVVVVHNTIRPTDLLFRFGGEEFCCLLPYTDAAQGAQVAERLRRAVEALRVELPGASAQVTASFGVASTASAGYDIDILMRQADLAVYEAKRQGRNRVASSERPGPQLVQTSAVA